jgi:glycosyltransferase involved in cell wall biosynthesis
MKVFNISYSDNSGGAARAAFRINQAMNQNSIDSTMYVNQKLTDDFLVKQIHNGLSKRLLPFRASFGSLVSSLLKTSSPIIHSPSILPSRWPKFINNSDADIIHLNWINAETLSIADIRKINKPIVWTIVDMWAFCGAEHLSSNNRWKEGYSSSNRPSDESGLDLNRWTWRRKVKNWDSPIQIVTPSRWLAECVNQSKLMKNWPVTVIPNPVDTNIWQPIDKKIAKSLIGVPQNMPLILFGAHDGTASFHKGYDLLEESLAKLDKTIDNHSLAIFGQSSPKKSQNKIHYLGHLHDDLSLRIIYSAADVMVVPSRQESFGYAAAEAHACGTPVVAFSIGGLKDVVDHRKTGYLAEPFNTSDLALGIEWVLSEQRNGDHLSLNSRKKAVDFFSYESVSSEYLKVYKSLVN